MIFSHFELMLIYALCISSIIAILTKESSKEQFKYFIKFFISLVAIALIIGWLMYPFPK